MTLAFEARPNVCGVAELCQCALLKVHHDVRLQAQQLQFGKNEHVERSLPVCPAVGPELLGQQH